MIIQTVPKAVECRTFVRLANAQTVFSHQTHFPNGILTLTEGGLAEPDALHQWTVEKSGTGPISLQ
jgi:hypothetical protein